MKLYRWMSNEEFLKMQKGETIYGKDHSVTHNTSSKGICFFPKDMKVKIVDDEYRGIEVRPVDLTPIEIVNLQDDTDYEYDGANGNLILLPHTISKDVFVEFEVDNSNVVNFLDASKMGSLPDNKVIENWGVYAKPYGAWFDRVLIFEYAIDHYNKEVLKPTRFVSFNKVNYPEFEDIIKDDDFKEYSDSSVLTHSFYIEINNDNLEEYRDLLFLRHVYPSRIADNLQNLHRDNIDLINYPDTENALYYERAERRFLKTIEEMYQSSSKTSKEDIKDVCYYTLFEEMKGISDEDFKEYKYYIESGVDEAFELFNEGKDLSYYLEKNIANDINTLYVGKLVEDGIEEYPYKLDTYKASQDMSNILKELFSYKKEFKKDYDTETLVKEVNEVAKKEGYRYVDENKDLVSNEFRNYIGYVIEEGDTREFKEF